MTNILFLITKSEVGGAQKWVREQLELLPEQYTGFLWTNCEGWLSKNLSVQCTFNKAIEKRFSIFFIIKLFFFLRNKRISLVVASSANAGLYSRLACFFTKVPVIYVSHGWSSIYNGGRLTKFYNFVEKILSNLTCKIICVSNSDLVKARSVIGINEEKLILIPNKVRPNYRQRDFVCANNNVPIRLLTLARLKRPKRFDILIEAVADTEDTELHVFGDGPDLVHLMEQCQAQNWSQIFFHGEVSDFCDFCNYDAFILISDSEGMPCSAIEAMASGLPLILSNVGGCVELIDGNGVLVINDVNAIKEAVNELKNQRLPWSHNSKKLFEEKHNLVKSVSIYHALYDRCAK